MEVLLTKYTIKSSCIVLILDEDHVRLKGQSNCCCVPHFTRNYH